MRVSLLGALSAGVIASLFAFSAAADSIRIGLISEITGPNAEAGSSLHAANAPQKPASANSHQLRLPSMVILSHE